MEQFKDCYYIYENCQLKIGNKLIERTIDFSENVPITVSFKNKQQECQWIDPSQTSPMFYFPFLDLTHLPDINITSCVDNDLGMGKEHLEITASLQYKEVQIQVVIKLYPELPFLRQFLRVKVENPCTYNFLVPDNKAELDENKTKISVKGPDYFDLLALKELHCRWKCVTFRDVTDRNNNLLSKESGLLYTNENRILQGNILIIQQSLNDSGLLLIKEGPSSLGYITDIPGDFQIKRKNIIIAGSGIKMQDLMHGKPIETYSETIGVFQGAEFEYLKLIHEVHQARHRNQPERDFFIMSNTWGDRSKDGRVCEQFILAELETAKQLGITHVQIDDGWQKGISSNSVLPGGTWGDYYSRSGFRFWDVHPERFPHGLEPVAEKAREYGIQLGLWFSPDSTNDFAHWEEDSQTLIELYWKHRIKYFKIDGIEIRSKYGQENLVRMLQKVIRETGGNVYFNLDVTAGVRLGYFSDTQYSSLFLENRYTDFGNYYPHWTLRNLWMLAKYIPTQKFQIEFLNVKRNCDRYKDDPLAPDRCGIAYAFAIVMFSNPLAWMELTGLCEESKEILQRLIAEYRTIQKEILNGFILPIGQEPNGTNWTGFQSILGDNRGYVIIFREFTSSSEGTVQMWNQNNKRLNLIPVMKMEETNKIMTGKELGNKEKPVQSDEMGYCKFTLGNPFSFALYRYE